MSVIGLPPIDPHRAYTFAEAAPYFGTNVSARRVRRWVEEGKLPAKPLPGGTGRVILGQTLIDYFTPDAR